MYRTGDLARRRRDGVLELLGRADDQVTIRGFRIEPAEVAAVLADHPGVRRAVVVVRNDTLVGYVTGSVDAAQAREHAVARLPGHMVPGVVVVLDELPLNTSGKVDTAALPAPSQHPEPRAEQRAATPQEQALADLYAEVLGAEPGGVGPHDGFFALGGHSLLATRLVSRIRAVLGAEVELRAVFDAPTPAQLAARLDGTRATRPALERRDRPERPPLSHAQQRLWFLDQLAAGADTTYNIAWAWRLSGPVDAAALEAALGDVVDRHEALRTVFGTDALGEPFQLVLPAGTHPGLDVIDGDRAELTRAASHAFDLAGDLPVRGALVRTGPEEHLFLLLVHHIAADGWSLPPLRRDLDAAYAARLAGAAPALDPLPVQYVDYTLWQREMLGSDDDADSVLAAQARYWRTALAGLPDELTLPGDRARPVRSSGRGGLVRFAVPAAVHERLRSLAAENDASTFMVLHAALATLLTRLGAGTDVPLGSPIAGRTDHALDELAGFFVNTLVLRTDTSGDPSFRSLLERVRETDLAAYAHQDLPFERLVEILNPARSLSRHPLFQVMLAVYRGGAGAPEEVLGLPAEFLDTGLRTAKFDLSFDLVETSAAGIAGEIEYALDLYDEATVTSLAQRFVRVLTALAEDPDRPLSTLPVLGDDERATILDGWGVGPAPSSGPTTLVELFDAAVARHPDATAISDAAGGLTFAELASRSRARAARLVEAGAGPGTVVAILLPRGADYLEAIWSTLRSGAAYLPLDPDQPPARLAEILADAAPVAVLERKRCDIAGVQREESPIDHGGAAPRSVPFDGPPAQDDVALTAPSPDDAAYVIYTSGSTGRPKGVVVPHGAIANLFAAHNATLHRPAVARAQRENLRAGHAWPFSFDASWQPQLWMLDGHEVHVIDDETRRDPALLAARVRDRGLDFLELTPSQVEQVAAAGMIDDDGCALGVVGFGGEAVSPALWERLRALRDADGTEAFNLYGPTEATVDALVARVADAPAPVVGGPVAGARARVLDAALNPVAPGVAGELYIAGAGLARGYLGQPGQTADRFVADPFSAGGERMYRTGDLARFDGRGHLHYLGRADDQVKVRGFRVEPGEIAAVLAAHPDVAQAIVVPQDGPGGARLVAYTTPAGTDTAALRAHAAATLPGHMVPAAFVTLDGVPVTANGKVDHAALPAPDPAAPGRAPAGPLEETLCGLWAEALDVDRVGADDDVFDLGGHSMMLVRLRSRIADETGADVPIAELFRNPTPADLATYLEGR